SRSRRQRRRLLRRRLVGRLRSADEPAPRGHGAVRGGRAAGQEGRPGLRAVEGAQARGADPRLLALAVASGTAGLAHRMLGHVDEVAGRELRHPRRPPPPAPPPPSERARPVTGGRSCLREHLDALRPAQRRRRQDVEVTGNSVFASDLFARFSPLAVRYFLTGAGYRSTLDFSDEAMERSESSLERLTNFLQRARQSLGDNAPALPDVRDGYAGRSLDVPVEFAAALDDDLGVPRALSVVFASVTEGAK